MKRDMPFRKEGRLPATTYRRPPVKKSERAKRPWLYAYKDKVTCKTLALHEPKFLSGRVVGVWYDARNIENFYAVKLDDYPNDKYPYPVAVFPESHVMTRQQYEEISQEESEYE